MEAIETLIMIIVFFLVLAFGIAICIGFFRSLRRTENSISALLFQFILLCLDVYALLILASMISDRINT
jgi:hypothetical protein